MKKITLILTIFLFLLWGYSISLKADVFEGNPVDNRSACMLRPDIKFNVLKGISTEESLENSHFLETYRYDIDDYLIHGEMTLTATIHSDLTTKLLKTTFYVSNSIFYKYQAYIDDYVFYEFVFEDSKPKITICEELDLYKVIGYTENNFTITSDFTFEFSPGADYHYLDSHNEPTGYIPDQEFIEDIGFTSLYAMAYKINDLYETEEVHFITECSNPISFDEIINSLSVEDITDGQVTNISIIDSTYHPETGCVQPASYTFTIRAIDYAGNTTLQYCTIDVYDSTPPVITGKNLTLMYFHHYTNKDLLNQFTATDLTECTIEIIENNYEENHNKPGVYTVTALATDEYGNTATATINVRVNDIFSPIVTTKDEVVVTTQDDYTIDYFRQFIYVEDECDGEISDFIIIDEEDYMNHKKIVGNYRFTIEATDSSNNTKKTNFYVKVVDPDYPVISVNEYTIVISKDHKITKEEIISILKKTGQISSDNVNLSSQYFEDESPEGIYAMITEEAGEKYNNKIEIYESEIRDYTPITPKPQNTNNNKIYYIALGIAGGILVLIISLSTILYKKRH